MGKRISGVDVNTVLLVGGAVAAYILVVKPLLDAAGVDPVSAGIINAEMALPPAQNPFNYQFQPFVDFYNNNTPSVTAGSGGFLNTIETNLGWGQSLVTTNSPTIQQFFQACRQSPPVSSPWGLLDVPTLCQGAEQLNSVINGITFTTTDQGAAIAPFSGLNNQMQVAFIANYFFWNFNQDLLTDLQGSLFKTGISPSNLAAIITAVNNLPQQPTV